ncbi:MAG: hydrogenase accessory protein HypB [Rhodospirillaceae bacterium]|nr:hydrogenase accessory protein HypB [Rhodospirillaceae bacterium]
MCGHCGCGSDQPVTVIDLQAETSHGQSQSHAHEHHHHHDHGGEHHHTHVRSESTVVELNARILAKNDALAARNRSWFAGREILALNLMSAPGAGKTALLERTLADLNEDMALSVIEGDQAGIRDAERIRAAGTPVVQVNTGTGCHLDAAMVAEGLATLKPTFGSVLFIENVGNLVCPALFDLGERRRVAILSVTEGDDKPIKYPHMFRAADLLLLNKIDLLEHVDFDADRAEANAREVSPDIQVIRVSAKTGAGFAAWYDWLTREHALLRDAALP